MRDMRFTPKPFAAPIVAAIWFLGAVCFLTASACVTFAQTGNNRPTPVERRTELLNRQGTEYDRDRKGPPENPTDRKRALDLAEQVKEDFEGLQKSHNQIVLFMADKQGLDRNHNSIFQEVADIKKYAVRLKTNLALPKSKHDKTPEGDDEQLEESLLALRKHIYDFVTNPLFESQRGLNVEQGTKAGHDLESIIQLSERITKNGDRIKKSN